MSFVAPPQPSDGAAADGGHRSVEDLKGLIKAAKDDRRAGSVRETRPLPTNQPNLDQQVEDFYASISDLPASTVEWPELTEPIFVPDSAAHSASASASASASPAKLRQSAASLSPTSSGKARSATSSPRVSRRAGKGASKGMGSHIPSPIKRGAATPSTTTTTTTPAPRAQHRPSSSRRTTPTQSSSTKQQQQRREAEFNTNYSNRGSLSPDSYFVDPLSRSPTPPANWSGGLRFGKNSRDKSNTRMQHPKGGIPSLESIPRLLTPKSSGRRSVSPSPRKAGSTPGSSRPTSDKVSPREISTSKSSPSSPGTPAKTVVRTLKADPSTRFMGINRPASATKKQIVVAVDNDNGLPTPASAVDAMTAMPLKKTRSAYASGKSKARKPMVVEAHPYHRPLSPTGPLSPTAVDHEPFIGEEEDEELNSTYPLIDMLDGITLGDEMKSTGRQGGGRTKTESATEFESLEALTQMDEFEKLEAMVKDGTSPHVDSPGGDDARADPAARSPKVSPARVTLLGAGSQAERSEKLLRLKLEVNPQDADSLYELAHLLGDTGREDEAAAVYRTALAIDPEHEHGIAHVINGSGASSATAAPMDYEPALRADIETDPQDAASMYELAHLLRSRGREHEAATVYRTALAIRPEHADGVPGAASARPASPLHDLANSRQQSMQHASLVKSPQVRLSSHGASKRKTALL